MLGVKEKKNYLCNNKLNENYSKGAATFWTAKLEQECTSTWLTIFLLIIQN